MSSFTSRDDEYNNAQNLFYWVHQEEFPVPDQIRCKIKNSSQSVDFYVEKSVYAQV